MVHGGHSTNAEFELDVAGNSRFSANGRIGPPALGVGTGKNAHVLRQDIDPGVAATKRIPETVRSDPRSKTKVAVTGGAALGGQTVESFPVRLSSSRQA